MSEGNPRIISRTFLWSDCKTITLLEDEHEADAAGFGLKLLDPTRALGTFAAGPGRTALPGSRSANVSRPRGKITINLAPRQASTHPVQTKRAVGFPGSFVRERGQR
jgi:hypothetical protein